MRIFYQQEASIFHIRQAIHPNIAQGAFCQICLRVNAHVWVVLGSKSVIGSAEISRGMPLVLTGMNGRIRQGIQNQRRMIWFVELEASVSGRGISELSDKGVNRWVLEFYFYKGQTG